MNKPEKNLSTRDLLLEYVRLYKLESWKEDLVHLLLKHEGLSLKPYLCAAGKTTIGVGRNLDTTGITEEEAAELLVNDINRIIDQAGEAFPWIESLDNIRKNVIYSMIFNMGFGGVRTFKKMIEAIKLENYTWAAAEMLDSRWAAQVKGRALELAYAMRVGAFPESCQQY